MTAEKRIRVNAKVTSKGLWQLDVTVEVTDENVTGADINILEIIKEKEKEFAADGRKMVETDK